MADVEDRDDDALGVSGDEKIVLEAKKRHRRCRDWEGDARKNSLEDTKFAEGDSRNGYQWDEKQRNARTSDGRPALTINKVRQGCLQIINDQRQNKSQIRVRPVGDGASFPAAEVYEGIVRHIEYASNAMETYDSAAWHQITGGYGAWRVTTEYADDGSLDQDIFIRRIKDPNTVWLDPDINEFDGSDARYGFVTKDLSRDAFRLEYPEWADKIPDGRSKDFAEDDAGWHDTDKVRVAEYFRRVATKDMLHHVQVPDDAPWPAGVPRAGVVKQSDHPEEHHETIAAMATRSRPITSHRVEWFKIAGDQIIERGEWAGRFIPLVRVIGEETVLDGKLDRKGHVRALLDPQRMMNYYASQAVEFVAGQTKTPWIGAAEAFEGVETIWSDPSTSKGYLPYNAYDEQGRKIEKPERVQPPVSHPAASEGMDRAERQMMAASGQYQAQFGENENAKSGVAIQTRQRQGDNATYHYIDHMAQAQRLTGRILIDLIPKVYDTPRVIKIMAEDGEQSDVQVQPGTNVPHQQVATGPNGQPAQLSPDQVAAMQADKALADKVKTIFDPTVGRYDVEADVGPSFSTKRQEAFNALSQIMQNNPEAMKIGGDLMWKAAEFPMSDELAERWRRTLPPDVLGAAPPPAVLQAQQQLKGLQAQMQKLMQQLHDKGQQESRADAEEKRKDYEAETARMVALAKIYPDEFQPAVRQLMSDVMQTPIIPLMAAHDQAEQAVGLTPPPAPPAAPGAAPSPGEGMGGPGQGASPPRASVPPVAPPAPPAQPQPGA